MKNTKAQNIAAIIRIVTSLLKSLERDQLVMLIRNMDKIKFVILQIAGVTKKHISLQCLRDSTKAWGWNQEQQDKVGLNMKVVLSPESVWSGPDDQFLDTDPGNKFGQATITAEQSPFDFADTSRYIVRIEKDLFPNIDFTQEPDILRAIRKFVDEVAKLNKIPGGKRYYIPGLDYMDFIHNNQDKIPEFMKDGRWYYYPAANFRCRGGLLYAPCSFPGSRFGGWVGYSWVSSGRFLVLEII